jgi:hypothetical protein
MAKLNAKARNRLPDSAFAGPGRSYPIEDPGHARNALARAAQHASPGLEAKIKAKVRRKYPSIRVEGEAPKPRGDRASRSRKG